MNQHEEGEEEEDTASAHAAVPTVSFARAHRPVSLSSPQPGIH